MLDNAYIARNLRGGLMVMLGRREALELLDISADGFWRSFQAIIIALPPLALSWFAYGHALAGGALSVGDVVFRAALVDAASWFVPLIALAYAAIYLGFSDRYAHYVVASNWASALLPYLLLPSIIAEWLAPQAKDVISFLSLAMFVASLVFVYRMTHVALNRPLPLTIAVFTAMLLFSLLVIVVAQKALGLG